MARKKKRFSAFYEAYMQSLEWKQRSAACIARAGCRCQRCGQRSSRGNPLQSHHLTYVRLGHEHPDDLLCLCKRCHRFADFERKKLQAFRRKRCG